MIALPDGWCVYYTESYTLNDMLFAAVIDSGPVILCFAGILVCLSLVIYKVGAAASHATGPSHVTGTRHVTGTNHVTEDYSQPLLAQNTVTQMRVVRSIINHIIITFLICYSAALYIEVRQIIMAFGGMRYDFVTFPQVEGPPQFMTSRLIVFRLKFTLTIIFSIINPLLVFRGSYLFRSNIGMNIFNDDFSYVLSEN